MINYPDFVTKISINYPYFVFLKFIGRSNFAVLKSIFRYFLIEKSKGNTFKQKKPPDKRC
ncbi:MAG: hypothetical protein EBS34_01960 [Flavobacteriales bacterium]|nr:hypothetical protein [Flavobacteriales bacterium]